MLFVTLVALAAPTNGQQYDRSRPAGGPFSRDAVLNAPFSADATTIIRTTLPNGTPRIDTVKARYYRDSQGRVRAEVDTPWSPYVLVMIPTPERPERFAGYLLDLDKRTYRLAGSASQIFNGEGRVALPVGKNCFMNAPRVLVDASDEERLRAVNAHVSPDIGIVTESHRSDSIATVDYKVTNIRRDEPSTTLFDVTDYTLVDGSLPDEPLVSFSPWQSPPACGPRR
jgi:hypothetical protein